MIHRVSRNIAQMLNTSTKKSEEKDTGFMDLVKLYINDVNKKQVDADKAIEKFIKGQETDITSTVLAVEKAEVSLQLFLQIRNKLLQAYQEIMRIQA